MTGTPRCPSTRCRCESCSKVRRDYQRNYRRAYRAKPEKLAREKTLRALRGGR